MKKWNDDGQCCDKCLHFNMELGCGVSLKEGLLGFLPGGCSNHGHRFYENKKETERLLNLWDDANGSVEEWRDNSKIIKRDQQKNNCGTCVGLMPGLLGNCVEWQLNAHGERFGCLKNGYKFYANRIQTEAILEWHDDRFGKIDELKEKESDVEDFDFRYGDPVWTASIGNLVVTDVDEKRVYTSRPSRTGSIIAFAIDGKSIHSEAGDGNRILFHGHNLKVTVEEEMPVRIIIKHESVYRDPKTGELRIKTSGKDMGYVVPDGWERVYGPVKVQIPE